MSSCFYGKENEVDKKDNAEDDNDDKDKEQVNLMFLFVCPYA